MLLRLTRAVLGDHYGDEADQQPLHRDGNASRDATQRSLAQPQHEGTDKGQGHPRVANEAQELRRADQACLHRPSSARGAHVGEPRQGGLAVRTLAISDGTIGDGHISSRKVMLDDASRTPSSATPLGHGKAGRDA